MMDDAELLLQYATKRSDPAFAELVRRHVDLVYSVALRKVGGDAHSAEDVSQAVFLALSRQARALTKRRALSGWLYLTTHNLAAQFVRADRRRQNREHAAHTMKEILDTPDIDWHRLRPVLDEALQALGEQDREAVLLRYFEQRAFAEIGRTLRVTEDAARMRVDRALEKLRTLLARRGVASTAAALAAVLGSQVAAAPAGLATAITSAVATSAVAGAGAGATSSFLLMHLTKIIPGTLTVAAIGAAVHFSNTARQEAADLAASQQERAALQAKLTDLETRVTQSTQQPRTLQDQVPPPQTAAKPARATPSVTKPDTLTVPVVEERERKVSAEVRQADIQRMVAGYDPLFKKLGLTPAQIEEFRALLTANFARHADLGEFDRSQGVGALAGPVQLKTSDGNTVAYVMRDQRPVDPDVQALEAQADADLAGRIRGAFGDATYDAYQYFNDIGPIREITSHLTAALAAAGTPLTASEADRLVEALATAARGPDGQINANPHAIDPTAYLAQAQSVLSGPQLAALRQILSERR
jgi:RNA polymerase sigma factor (sigma-70 family)